MACCVLPCSRYNADYSGLFAHKQSAVDNNFAFSLNAAVRTSDNEILPLLNIEKVANAFSSGIVCGYGKFLQIESTFDDKNKYLLNDTLTLIIDIMLCRHDPLEAVQQNPLTDALVYLIYSKEFSDITLISSDEKAFPAHRCILSSRSSVFKILLTADMLEKKQMSKFENKTSRIVIDDIDGDTMREVLRFIYTNKVKNIGEFATKLIYATEKYDLQDLKSICAKELTTQITSETAFELLVLADRFNEDILLEKCMYFIDSHFEELKEEEEDWKKISKELMMKCMQYSKEFVVIALVSSL